MDISYWCWIMMQSAYLGITFCAIFGGAVGAILCAMSKSNNWAKILIYIILGAMLGIALCVALIFTLDIMLCTFN